VDDVELNMSTNPVISAVIDMLLEKLMLDGPVDDTQKDILIEVGSNELQGVGFGTDKGWRALKYIIDCMASIKIVGYIQYSSAQPVRSNSTSSGVFPPCRLRGRVLS
jgi:hypothetical protein